MVGVDRKGRYNAPVCLNQQDIRSVCDETPFFGFDRADFRHLGMGV
jgi:hypothetical protein